MASNGSMEESVNSQASAEGASKPVPTKLRSVRVSVLEPSTSKVKNGSIQPFSVGRTRSSSTRSSASSPKAWFGKDVWLKAELYLTPTALCYSLEGVGVCELLLEDVLGIQVIQSPAQSNPNACEFRVHLFLIATPKARKKIRMQCTATMLFDDKEGYKENLEVAYEWKTAVLLQTQRAIDATFGAAGIDKESLQGSVEVGEDQSVLVARKFLIFLNPKAGSQKGESLFHSEVKPMLELAEINYVLKKTERQNHAREMIKNYNLKNVDVIVISSGDGLLYEVINGIMERPDWEKAIKIPIGMLPTGSGNGLCASTLLESKEEYGLAMAAFQIIRGGVAPLDVATVQLEDGSSMYMVLFCCWGMVADIDIESEKFRKIGKTRFLVGAVSRILQKTVYSGKLSYLATEGPGKEPETRSLDALDTASTGSSEEGETTSSGGGSVGNDSPPLRIPPAGESGEQSKTDDDDDDDDDDVITASGQSLPTADPPPADLLVPFDKPSLPDTWTTKEVDFLAFNALSVPLLSSDFYGDPDVTMGSGSMRLVWVDGSLTRRGALNLMTLSETGRHTTMEQVYTIDVKAFRIEPKTAPGTMTVDGEVVNYGSIQAQVHPQLARVMSRRRK